MVIMKPIFHRKPEYTIDIIPAEDGYEIAISADTFVRGVFFSLEGIDNFFSDNYFDILPGVKKTIQVTTSLPESEFRKQLKIISIGDIHSITNASVPSETLVKDADFKPIGM